MLAMLIFLLIQSSLKQPASSHAESSGWICESGTSTLLRAEFRPGTITLDGRPNDWDSVDGFKFPLLPALDPDSGKEYTDGKMTVKALHDGNNVFFLLQVNGDYAYKEGDGRKCPSVSIMFRIGDEATYYSMGGCNEGSGSCTSKSCKGHEVDIMHFSIGNAIPGQLYGGDPLDNSDGNGGDRRFSHLVDLYAWNPHCRYLDGSDPSGNDSSALNNWTGAWSHSCLNTSYVFVEEDSPYGTIGLKGTYHFEFSRSLRTMDHLRQDAQFTIGGTSKMAVAFWYPVGGIPWHGSEHYAINCDWILLDIAEVSSKAAALTPSTNSSSAVVVAVFALVFSGASLCLSLFVGYNVLKPKNLPFAPIHMEQL